MTLSSRHVQAKQKKNNNHFRDTSSWFTCSSCRKMFCIVFWCLTKSCVGSDVLFQRQTDAHSLTNLPSGHPLTPRLSPQWPSGCDWMVFSTTQTSSMTHKVDKSLLNESAGKKEEKEKTVSRYLKVDHMITANSPQASHMCSPAISSHASDLNRNV